MEDKNFFDLKDETKKEFEKDTKTLKKAASKINGTKKDSSLMKSMFSALGNKSKFAVVSIILMLLTGLIVWVYAFGFVVLRLATLLMDFLNISFIQLFYFLIIAFTLRFIVKILRK